MNIHDLADFTRTAAVLVRANDDHHDDVTQWEAEVAS